MKFATEGHSIRSLLRLVLLSHLTISAYASCQISPRSTELDLCYASCAVAAQCVDQCDTTYCLCQPECLCFQSICQNCCVLSGNDTFCHAESADSLALCQQRYDQVPVQECNVFKGISYSPSSTIPGPQISSLIEIADVPLYVNIPSASNCQALFNTLGSAVFQFTYTGATSTATVASYTSVDFSDDGGSFDSSFASVATSLSLSGAAATGSQRFSLTSTARTRTPTSTTVSTTTATVAATTSKPSSTSASAPGAAPIGFQVEMMTLALLVIGTLLVVLA